MLKRLVGGVAATTVIGSGLYGKYKYERDEGFRRALTLYSVAGPVVLHYRLTEAKQKLFPQWFYESEEAKSEEWLSLDNRYSGQMVAMLKDLKGMYTKYGQIAAGMNNTFSEVWTEKLRELEDNVPPKPIEVVLETIKEDTGKDPSEIFSSFEALPLGSASIGQVHKAVLRETGQEVAVKVQYPDSLNLFREDMKTIRNFLELAAPEQVIIMDELERSFEREFDYRIEAENLAFFHKHLAPFFKEVAVPKPLKATNRMLIMELLHGKKLVDGIRSYGKLMAEKQGRSFEEMEKEIKEKILREGMPAKYEGPSGWKISLYQEFCRVSEKVLNSGVWLANMSLTPFTSKRIEYYSFSIPPNAPVIMDCLMRVHGYQLLKLGSFNADPHAGNFLLLEDDRIGLIDYGATKVMTRGERLAACVLFACLYKKDRARLMDMVRVGGYRSKNFDEDVIWDLCRFGFDTFGQDLLKGKNVQQFMDELYAKDPWYEAASNLTMAQFLSIRLRSVGMSLLFPVVCSEWWGPMALDILEEEGLPFEMWDRQLMLEKFEEVQISKGSSIPKLFSSGKFSS